MSLINHPEKYVYCISIGKFCQIIKKFWKSLLLLRQTWRSATSLQQLGWSVFLSLKFQVDDISNDFKPRRIFSEDYHFEKREESTVQLVGGKEERGDADLSWSARVCQVTRSSYWLNDWYIQSPYLSQISQIILVEKICHVEKFQISVKNLKIYGVLSKFMPFLF